jgi:hypothetical protein
MVGAGGLCRQRKRALPAEKAGSAFSGAFKTHTNPWEGQTQEIPTL